MNEFTLTVDNIHPTRMGVDIFTRMADKLIAVAATESCRLAGKRSVRDVLSPQPSDPPKFPDLKRRDQCTCECHTGPVGFYHCFGPPCCKEAQ